MTLSVYNINLCECISCLTLAHLKYSSVFDIFVKFNFLILTFSLHIFMLSLDSACKSTALHSLEFYQYLNTVPMFSHMLEAIIGLHNVYMCIIVSLDFDFDFAYSCNIIYNVGIPTCLYRCEQNYSY